MKLSKKLGLFVATTIAAVGFTCAAHAIEQKDATYYSVRVALWSDDVINHTQYIDYQYSTDKSFADPSKIVEYKDDYIGSSSSFVIGNDLPSGKSLWIRWRDAGKGSYSAPYEVVTTPRFDDSAKITQTSATANSATFTWSAAAGATGYRVLDKDGNLIDTVSTNSATLNIKELGLYKVEPIRKASTTPFVAKDQANSLSIELKNTPSVPSNITYYSDWYTWGHFLKFDWDSSNGADGYDFEYALYNGKKKVVEDCEDSFASIDSKKQFYRIRVRAYVKIGNNKYYSDWSGYKYLAEDTTDVVKLKATTGKKKKIRVSWMRIKGAKKYIIYMAKNNNGGYKKIKTTKKRTIIVNKFKKKKLQKGAEYYFKVIAVGKFDKKTVKSENVYYSSIKVE